MFVSFAGSTARPPSAEDTASMKNYFATSSWSPFFVYQVLKYTHIVYVHCCISLRSSVLTVFLRTLSRQTT